MSENHSPRTSLSYNLFLQCCDLVGEAEFDKASGLTPALPLNPYYNGLSAVTFLAKDNDVSSIIDKIKPFFMPWENKHFLLKNKNKPVLYYDFYQKENKSYLKYFWIYKNRFYEGEIDLEQDENFNELRLAGKKIMVENKSKSSFETILAKNIVNLFPTEKVPFLKFYYEILKDALIGYGINFKKDDIEKLISEYGVDPHYALIGMAMNYKKFSTSSSFLNDFQHYFRKAPIQTLPSVVSALAKSNLSFHAIRHIVTLNFSDNAHVILAKSLPDLLENYALINNKIEIDNVMHFYHHLFNANDSSHAEESLDVFESSDFENENDWSKDECSSSDDMFTENYTENNPYREHNQSELHLKILSGTIKGNHYDNIAPVLLKYDLPAKSAMVYLNDPLYLHLRTEKQVIDIINSVKNSIALKDLKHHPIIKKLLIHLNQYKNEFDSPLVKPKHNHDYFNLFSLKNSLAKIKMQNSNGIDEENNNIIFSPNS